MNRRAFLAVLPSIALAGCAARLGLAQRVEIVRKYVRLHPRDESEPIDAAVRRYDPDEGPYYDDEIHEALADDISEDEPLRISEALAERLAVDYETVEYRIRGYEPNTEGGDWRYATLVRDDFNAAEPGDTVDLVFGTSGAGLVAVHEDRGNSD